MAAHRVQALLMGGQACVLYGAAEFSRDVDFSILAEAANLERLKSAMKELKARCIAVPPFAADYLRRGHAVHFRCDHPDAKDIRVDLMARLRDMDDFAELWKRRTTLSSPDGTAYEMLSPADLVQAKKTQRDKDWLMLRRLVEAYYFQNRGSRTPDKIRFWLAELRTPELLLEAAAAQPKLAREMAGRRPLLAAALANDPAGVARLLAQEEQVLRERDRLYWLPLKAELETLRHQRLQRSRGQS
jgi:hypothetical protein